MGRHDALVVADVLGMNDLQLRHVNRYEEFSARGKEAMTRFVEEVLQGRFPGDEHVRHLSAAELDKLENWETGAESAERSRG